MAQTPLAETQHTAEFLVSYASGHRSFDGGTLISGQNLQAGAVLGRIKTAAVPTVVGTGTGTMSLINPGPAAQVGTYTVTFLTATTYSVTDPTGNVMPAATALGAYTNAQMGWTITAGGTAFVAGDKFSVVLVLGKYTSLVTTATDGSEVPAGVLYKGTDATTGDKIVTVVVRDAEVNASELKWDASVTAGAVLTAATAQLAALGIIAR